MHFRWQSTKVRLREKLYLTSSSRKIVIRIYYNFKKLLLISMMALEKQWKWKCFSHVQLFCDPMDCSFPGSTVEGILQERILEWVAIPFSRASSRCRHCLLHCRHILYLSLSEPPGKPGEIIIPIKLLIFTTFDALK